MITNENIDKSGVFISEKSSENYQIIYISGKLEYQNMNIARNLIKELMDFRKFYILDFSNITRIDSTGFGLIFSIIKNNPNSKVSAVVTDPFITELFKITKIDQLIPIYDSEILALESINAN